MTLPARRGRALAAGRRQCSPELSLPEPALSSLVVMSDKSERRAARAVVADYHRKQLRELVARVGQAIDRHRAGELDPFEVDQVLFQYSRAAKELWKFCNYLQVEVAASVRSRPSPGVNDNGRRVRSRPPSQERKDYVRVESSIPKSAAACRD